MGMYMLLCLDLQLLRSRQISQTTVGEGDGDTISKYPTSIVPAYDGKPIYVVTARNSSADLPQRSQIIQIDI